MREKSAKILMVGPLPPPFSGGIASFIHGIRTCSALAEFEIHYLNTMVSKLVRKSVSRRVLFSLWLLTKLCACLTHNRPQLAHIHSSAFFSFYEKSVMLIICRLFGVRTILHLHSGHFHRFYSSTRIKFFVRFALNRTGTVIAVSPYWKTYFEKLCRKPVACVPNFATPKFFLPEQCGAPDGDILFVGKLSREKGIFDLLEAVSILRKQGFSNRLVLAGTASGYEEFERIKNDIAQPGLKPADLVLEAEPGKVRQLVEKAALFVIPSYVEGLPIAMLEAMAAHLPVVASPVGGIPDAIKNGENGYLVAPGNAAALAEKISLLLKNEVLRQRMGEAGYRTASEFYHADCAAEQLADLYKSILENQSR